MYKFVKKIKKNKSGLSLIEIMVAFLIIAVAFTAIIAIFPRAANITRGSGNASLSSFLAQEKIEQINAIGYDDIATGTLENLVRFSTSTSNRLYYYQRTTTAFFVLSSFFFTFER